MAARRLDLSYSFITRFCFQTFEILNHISPIIHNKTKTKSISCKAKDILRTFNLNVSVIHV